MLVTASSVPLLTFISSTVVPAVFDPACVVTIDVSVSIALLEFAGAVVPVAFIICFEGIFNLLDNFILCKLFEFVPGVKSPVILVLPIGVGVFAFIWKDDVIREITVAPCITCLNNKAIHFIVIFIQNWEGVKIKN